MGHDGEAENTMPPAQKSSWFSFLKSLSNVSDLSSLTAPSFILAPTSLAEFPAYWAEHPDQIATIEQGADAEERMLRVTQFFISTFSGSYTSRGTETGSEKKPLNPVLGEIFQGQWSKYNQWLVAEQVSHHPPKTAYHVENGAFRLDGHSGQKTSFNGRHILVKQVGHAMVTLNFKDGQQEKYLITLPTLKIDGLWIGSPFTELIGTCQVQSSTGFTSTIDLKGKGFFSGKVHTFKCAVKKTGSDDALHEIEGQWSGKSTYMSSSRHKGEMFWNAENNPSQEIEMRPLDEQDELESRKLWKGVADGIRKGDFDSASKAKSKIETSQRAQRKEREQSGKQYQLRYFEFVASDSDYKRLGSPIKIQPPEEETYVWNGTRPPFKQ